MKMADTKTLEEYRKNLNISYLALAGLLGITGNNPARTVERWCKGVRKPEPANMRRIIKRTNGSVTPGSFYGLTQ
jgi:transcriptional regulator with XRE-family HTH domain